MQVFSKLVPRMQKFLPAGSAALCLYIAGFLYSGKTGEVKEIQKQMKSDDEVTGPFMFSIGGVHNYGSLIPGPSIVSIGGVHNYESLIQGWSIYSIGGVHNYGPISDSFGR